MIGRIDSLPRRLADGARYLVDHPDDVVLLSMREIANRAGWRRRPSCGSPARWAIRTGRSCGRFTPTVSAPVGALRGQGGRRRAAGQGAGLLGETFRAQEASLAYAVESNAPQDIAAAAGPSRMPSASMSLPSRAAGDRASPSPICARCCA
ncbi:MAG: hypothetical protein HPM95_08870 [Alphaproteobacteria bacterium]|nr:hypothetical protein [Alphaproteobacteria bacterium]